MKEAKIKQPQPNAQQQNQPTQQHASAEQVGGSAGKKASELGFALQSPQSKKLAQFQAMANSSPQQQKIQSVANHIHNSSRMHAQQKRVAGIQSGLNNGNGAVQQQAPETSLLENVPTTQLKTEPLADTKKEPALTSPTQLREKPKQENNTGLPDTLKTGIENLSGMSMDDVKVHYNSSKPAQLQAHAYAQGSDIHLGAGQEKHLPHEAWHVVQQKQGRVRPTLQMKGGVNVNDDEGLEREADVMGGRALQRQSSSTDQKRYPKLDERSARVKIWNHRNENDEKIRAMLVEEFGELQVKTYSLSKRRLRELKTEDKATITDPTPDKKQETKSQPHLLFGKKWDISDLEKNDLLSPEDRLKVISILDTVNGGNRKAHHGHLYTGKTHIFTMDITNFQNQRGGRGDARLEFNGNTKKLRVVDHEGNSKL
ncbi:DUF4157 domain-containing protein [Agarivorans sp. DSG3-1]|uniref:eCIS core domain-containing protein n=1 Tax=Agarivorans sp. DSG3-1 TaxID=3342249 RepID=UPI00398EDA6B